MRTALSRHSSERPPALVVIDNCEHVIEARRAATMGFLMASLWVLVVQARPLQRWKVALVGAMAGL